MLLKKIPPYFAAQNWAGVCGHIEKAQPYSHGEWTMEQIKSDIHTGRVELISVLDGEDCVGAVAYVMQNRRNSRCAFVVAIGGAALASQGNYDQLRSIFKSEGATEIEGAGRPAIVRLWSQFGFEPKHQIFGVQI